MGQRQPFQQKPLEPDRFLGSAVTTICCARAPLGPAGQPVAAHRRGDGGAT